MGARIIHDKERACLYDSTNGVAFGPVFEGLDAYDQARHFRNWLNNDPREYGPLELAEHHRSWAEQNLDAEHGELSLAATRQLEEDS